MNKILVVALGGAIGAAARYWLGGLISALWPTQFPLGTVVINITGSFILGCFLTLANEQLTLHPHWRLLIAVGFVGAYTTFSTFEYETLKLIEEGNVLSAVSNVILSVTIGFMAVWFGAASARWIGHTERNSAKVEAVRHDNDIERERRNPEGKDDGNFGDAIQTTEDAG